ncbi:hypothetical protein [Micromonospora aurantiaca (nom. illeg.)]|uniref:hypothetical protein n=1 Tax=Micromonospora aurantiaca (nom. illeg.) TaxID=47850 RepID=UPI003F49BF43
MLVTSLAIGSLLWIVLASENMSNVAQAAIAAISTVAAGAIGAFSLVLGRRGSRNNRS